MPNKKLTDNEIVKALPKVLYGGHGCKNCKYDNGKGDDRCGLKGCKIARYALDLINRLQADCENYKQVAEHQQKLNLDKSFEIKRLKEEYPFKCKVGNNSEIHSKSIEDYDRLINDIQAEAYKEFAERSVLKIAAVMEHIKQNPYDSKNETKGTICGLAHAIGQIKDLLKELKGEGNV